MTIILPSITKHGRELSKEKLSRVVYDFAERYKGCTNVMSSEGLWKNQSNELVSDKSISIYTVTEWNNESWLNHLELVKEQFKADFEQDDIWIEYQEVYTV